MRPPAGFGLSAYTGGVPVPFPVALGGAILVVRPGTVQARRASSARSFPRDGRPRGALTFAIRVGAWGAVPFRRFPSRFLLLLSSPLVPVAAGLAGASISGLGVLAANPLRVLLASPIDGDTLRVESERIRLHGIDAPESAQSCRAGGETWACGEAATRALRGRLAGRPVECTERDRDRYGRIVAVCRVDGADVNAWMVEQGWAVAYRTYSTDYVSHETAAKAARRGVWRGDFVEPSRWRRGKRLEAAASGVGDCRLKGNISQKDTRIYHVPGGQSYAKTRTDTAKGERWLCTEAEPRAGRGVAAGKRVTVVSVCAVGARSCSPSCLHHVSSFFACLLTFGS